MRAVIITGLVACLAGVAYAEGADKTKDTNTHKDRMPSASSKSSAEKGTTGPSAERGKQQQQPLNSNEVALLNDLHAANQMEIAAGKLALKNSDSKAVKDYGRMLTKDHTAADRKLKALSKRKSAELTKPAPKEMTDLERRKGADFDSAFLTMMVKDHGEAISLVERGRVQCEDADVKAFLDEVLPTLKKHQAEATRLQQLAQAQ